MPGPYTSGGLTGGGDMAEQTAPENSPGSLLAETASPKLKRKEYEHALRDLQSELCSLQDWVKETGQRIIVVFEGLEGAAHVERGPILEGDDGAGQPSHFSGLGPPSALRSRKVADVCAALPCSFSCSR